MYLRYRLSCQDVPDLSKRAERPLSRARLNWHGDETYIRVGGKWRFLWRAIDAKGLVVDFSSRARIHCAPHSDTDRDTPLGFDLHRQGAGISKGKREISLR